jgi:hypothetical protein
MSMLDVTQPGGARAQIRSVVPSVDLATLLRLLADHYPASGAPGSAFAYETLTYNEAEGRLALNTYGILRRLLGSKALKEAFSQTENHGFLRDLHQPSPNTTTRLGGRIYGDQSAEVAAQVDRLRGLIVSDLERFGLTGTSLLVQDPRAALTQLAAKVSLPDPLQPIPASVIPMEFVAGTRPAAMREHDLARVISAQEEIQAEDWLERLTDGMTRAQANRDEDFDQYRREKLAATLQQAADRPESQVAQFLNFLEDEALARVRLAVGFAIMRALAETAAIAHAGTARPQDAACLAGYVARVSALFALYGAPESGAAVSFDLSGAYDVDADFSFADWLVKSTFYGCLPVWPEGHTQLFESRSLDPTRRGVAVTREVTYRFRVNGMDPQTMKPAYSARLDRLRKVLRPGPADRQANAYRVRQALAQTVFLWLALNPAVRPEEMQGAAEQLSTRLSEEGRLGIERLLADLTSWQRDVRVLSGVLTAVLRDKARVVISQAQRAVDDLYLVVQQSVLNWTVIQDSHGKPREPLVKGGERLPAHVEWLKHVRVARSPGQVIDPLFSVRVRTSLQERTLARTEAPPSMVQVTREVPRALLNVAWLPMLVDETEQPVRVERRATGATAIERNWFMGAGIDVWYDPELLTPKDGRGQRYGEDQRRQFRAAGVAALTTLIYVVLQTVVRRSAEAVGQPVSVLLARFQTQGRLAAPDAGDQAVYAAAQAVETALLREGPTRMQGLVTAIEQGENAQRSAQQLGYKKQGAAYALFSIAPVTISAPTPYAIGKVAAIVYTTRPCDSSPDLPEADGYLFLARTYLAEQAGGSAGYRLGCDRMQSYVVESREAFVNPTIIVEEIARLRGLGYTHILLISNHFGNRRLNRSAQRHAPHTQTIFVDEVATKFPDVRLYMLRRDVFPAFRLRRRSDGESAFEVTRLAAHQGLTPAHQDLAVKQLIPIYTIATLGIVGADTENTPRPQSGFCTYFLDTDSQVRNLEWFEEVRANILGPRPEARESLLAVLRGLHFLESEKRPRKYVLEPGKPRWAYRFSPVLDPFGWVTPPSTNAAGEFQVLAGSHRTGEILFSLPALLSRVTDALHRKGR